MIGTIRWVVKHSETPLKISIVEDVIVEQLDGKEAAIRELFLGLKIDEDVPTGTYSAWLHVQDAVDLYYSSIVLDERLDGNVLPELLTFAQEKLLLSNNEVIGEPAKPKPVLHISTLNLMQEGKSKPHFKGIPRYISIIDSSIWNYYFNFEDLSNNNDNRSHIVSSIANNTFNGLYNLSIAREYADLNARMIRQSFLDDLQGHGEDVSPFLFHSEMEMSAKCKEIVPPLKRYQWRFLLIDDHAWRSMDKATETDELKVQKNSKLDVLSRTIRSMGFNVKPVIKSGQKIVDSDGLDYRFGSEDTNDPIVEIWGVESIKEAFTALKFKRKDIDLKPQKYDIILLDYLLGNHSLDRNIDKFGIENGYYLISNREYGYQFLRRLQESESRKKKGLEDPSIPFIEDGPVGQQFFMFISAFTTAVGERLRAEGLHRSEKKWYIAEGACPTNTPSLFCYYLARVMERRLNETCIDNLTYESILDNLTDIFTPKRLVNVKYRHINEVRENAYAKYNEILGLHYDYFALKEDEDFSLLVKSYLQRNENHMDALLEHLLQFIHLVAFGTVRQWPEIWEEYQFIVRTLEGPEKKIRNLSRLIERHIIELKSE